MNKAMLNLALAVTLLCGASAAPAWANEPPKSPSAGELFAVISSLDGAVFDAFNSCSSPEQLRQSPTGSRNTRSTT